MPTAATPTKPRTGLARLRKLASVSGSGGHCGAGSSRPRRKCAFTSPSGTAVCATCSRSWDDVCTSAAPAFSAASVSCDLICSAATSARDADARSTRVG
eukprot:7351833-Prymnesium_polylepis.1